MTDLRTILVDMETGADLALERFALSEDEGLKPPSFFRCSPMPAPMTMTGSRSGRPIAGVGGLMPIRSPRAIASAVACGCCGVQAVAGIAQ